MLRDENQIIDSVLENDTFTVRRRKILPWWIKVFAWIFMAFGVLCLVGFILGILGFQFQLSIYGFETNQPLSIVGVGITNIIYP